MVYGGGECAENEDLVITDEVDRPFDPAAFDSAIPQARPDVVFREIGDEVVAWSPIASAPLCLMPLSATILRLLDGGVSAGELVADLTEVLEVDETFARDLLRRELAAFDDAGVLASSVPSVDHAREQDVFPAPPNP